MGLGGWFFGHELDHLGDNGDGGYALPGHPSFSCLPSLNGLCVVHEYVLCASFGDTVFSFNYLTWSKDNSWFPVVESGFRGKFFDAHDFSELCPRRYRYQLKTIARLPPMYHGRVLCGSATAIVASYVELCSEIWSVLGVRCGQRPVDHSFVALRVFGEDFAYLYNDEIATRQEKIDRERERLAEDLLRVVDSPWSDDDRDEWKFARDAGEYDMGQDDSNAPSSDEW
jgi:hypothetical protein